jgi:type IV secretory pathway VirD2 relaxase
MNKGGRRAVVKVRITKLSTGNLAALRAHLTYLQRDGDRHQFRIIVSPDDGDRFGDLKPFVQDLTQDMARDLETKLDWVAIDHYNTGHPHCHIVMRGKAEDGQDLTRATILLARGAIPFAGGRLSAAAGV